MIPIWHSIEFNAVSKEISYEDYVRSMRLFGVISKPISKEAYALVKEAYLLELEIYNKEHGGSKSITEVSHFVMELNRK